MGTIRARGLVYHYSITKVKSLLHRFRCGEQDVGRGHHGLEFIFLGIALPTKRCYNLEPGGRP
jgi:hypothetical protein